MAHDPAEEPTAADDQQTHVRVPPDFFFVTGRDGKPPPDRHVFEKYTHILWVTEWGKKFLRDEDFDFVLVPDANPFTGEKYPLDSYLAASTEWQPLYRRDGVFLYQRRRRVSESGAGG